MSTEHDAPQETVLDAEAVVKPTETINHGAIMARLASAAKVQQPQQPEASKPSGIEARVDTLLTALEEAAVLGRKEAIGLFKQGIAKVSIRDAGIIFERASRTDRAHFLRQYGLLLWTGDAEESKKYPLIDKPDLIEVLPVKGFFRLTDVISDLRSKGHYVGSAQIAGIIATLGEDNTVRIVGGVRCERRLVEQRRSVEGQESNEDIALRIRRALHDGGSTGDGRKRGRRTKNSSYS